MSRCYDALVPSRLAVVTLIAANVVPLVGVLAWDWSIGTILVLYWLENGIIGMSNVVRMVLAAGPNEGHLAKAFLVPFFLVHYGLFWTVHGVFVTTFFADGGFGSGGFGSGDFGSGGVGSGGVGSGGVDLGPGAPFGFGILSSLVGSVAAGTLTWGVLSLALSHGVSLVSNFLLGGEYRRVTAAELMTQPYGRVVILHLTIIFGAFAAMLLGAPIGTLLILVVTKTVFDVGAHLREHRAMGEPRAGQLGVQRVPRS
jgi:hypothetical protein